MTLSPHSTGLASRIRTNAQRLEPPRREPGLDLARGLAILGMFAAHLILVPELIWSDSGTWLGVVEGRSSIIFATLAGVSLGLLAKSAADRAARRSASSTTTPHPTSEPGLTTGGDAQTGGNTARTSIMIRAVVIWALGIALLALEVPVYIVLPAYGVLLLAGAVMLTWPTRRLLVTAAVVAVIAPFVIAYIDRDGEPAPGTTGEAVFHALGWNYPFALWVAFIAVGLVVGRTLTTGTPRILVMTAAGGVAAVVGYAVVGPVGNAVVENYGAYLTPGTRLWALSVLQSYPHSSGVGEAIGSGGFAVAVIGLCVLIGRTWLRWMVWPIRVLGSMPLSAYTAHLVVWGVWILSNPEVGWVVDPLNGFRELDPFWPMTLAITAGCILWALLIGRGPLEEVLHVLSGPHSADFPATVKQPQL